MNNRPIRAIEDYQLLCGECTPESLVFSQKNKLYPILLFFMRAEDMEAIQMKYDGEHK